MGKKPLERWGKKSPIKDRCWEKISLVHVLSQLRAWEWHRLKKAEKGGSALLGGTGVIRSELVSLRNKGETSGTAFKGETFAHRLRD